MRILFLSAHPVIRLSDAQGYAIRISELARALRGLGHEVVLLIAGDQRDRQVAQRIYKRGVKRLVPSQIAQMLRELSFLSLDRQFYLRSRQEVDRIAPDVVLERFSFFHRSGMWLADRLGVPLVLDDISPIWEAEVYFQRALKGLARRIQSQVFARADALIAVSGAIKAYLVETGVPTQRIHVIHNGADCHRFSTDIDGTEIRERFGLENRTVVGFVGGFLPWHGVEALLDVAVNQKSRTEGMRFLLVGPASQGVNAGSSLFRKMESANDGRSVVFSGPVPHRNVPKYMAAMDIAVMPNSNRYGSPIKIFEYMAMGKSVVAPSLPPIEEIITHGEDGWLVDPTSSEDLWNAIEYLYEHPQVRHQMGIRARETVLRMFTWSQHAERLGLVLDCLRKTTLC